MTARTRRPLAMTLEGKMTWWISRRLNVLFRCETGANVGVTSKVKLAFDQAGLRWSPISARSGDVESALTANSAAGLFIDSFERLPKRFRPSVLNMLEKRQSAKMVWATVAVSDDDFDMGIADPAHDEGFDIVVDARTGTGK